MLNNYFKIASRRFSKDWIHSLINVMGIAMAFCSAILLFLTANFEWSYDDFHHDKNSIYRLSLKESLADGQVFSTKMPVPMMQNLKLAHPDAIQQATRYKEGSAQVKWKDKVFNKSVQYVDPDFLKMFSFRLIDGNTNSALDDPSSIILSQQIASSIFGSNPPMGEVLTLNLNGKQQPFVVRGILETLPANSSISADALIRFENEPYYHMDLNDWNVRTHQVYVRLNDQTTASAFEKNARTFMQRTYINYIENARSNGLAPDSEGQYISLHTTPLQGVHFYQLSEDNKSINPVYPKVLLGISILVMLIAYVNYINLTTSNTMSRAKEVGIRKYLGAKKDHLIFQFWGEASIVCCSGMLLGGILSVLLLPVYNSQFNLNLSYSQFIRPEVISTIILFFLVTTLFVGFYPAIVASRFNVLEILKGKVSNKIKVSVVNHGMLVVQFTISIFLITSTLVINQQVKLLQNKPLGYNRTEVISIPVGYEIDGYKLLDAMRLRLANYPQFVSITGADLNLGKGKDETSRQSKYGFTIQGKKVLTNALNVDFDYPETLGLEFIAGRSFDKKYSTDSTQSCIINQAMASQLGLKSPIGTQLPLNGGKTIIGVVKDYNFSSLHSEIEPITILFNKPFGLSYLFVRIRPNSSSIATMKLLEKEYLNLAPKSEFLGSFLEDNVNKQYEKELRIYRIFSTASIIAILLSCFGLFAMSLLNIQQRTKEIGVRKVLGASVYSILALISRDFVKLVLIAILLASPLAYYGMSEWLQGFPYRIHIQWWIFVLSGVIALAIVLMTITLHSIKAASANPIKAVKGE